MLIFFIEQSDRPSRLYRSVRRPIVVTIKCDLLIQQTHIMPLFFTENVMQCNRKKDKQKRWKICLLPFLYFNINNFPYSFVCSYLATHNILFLWSLCVCWFDFCCSRFQLAMIMKLLCIIYALYRIKKKLVSSMFVENDNGTQTWNGKTLLW